MKYLIASSLVALSLGGCSESTNTAPSDGAMDASSGPDGPPADPGTNCFADGESEHDGRFGVPETTFTIPTSIVQAGGVFYVNDVQATFPSVDWQHLDRLYIPAGNYAQLRLGNLPVRTADHPLVITNIGGQVHVGGMPANYLVSIAGGANWILTGRFDPVSKTGDAAFPGHRGNCYQNTRNTYGFVVDDNFHGDASGGVTELLSGNGRSGFSVGEQATNFEIEYVEVARVTFAAMLIKTGNVPTATMDGVKIHDNYIHDTMSEGLYLGSTEETAQQHVFTNLEIYNNRFVRTGSEAIQLGQIAGGSRIHNNVSLYAALNWRHNFECTGQDNNIQFGQRVGASELDHNLVVGGADTLFIFFPQLVASDAHAPGDGVTIHDNLFQASHNYAVYTWAAGSSPSYVVPNSTYTFKNNFFSDLVFDYDDLYPGSPDRNTYFQFASNPTGNPYVLDGNTYDGAQNHQVTNTNVTATNEQVASVAKVAFNLDGLPANFDYHHFEVWSPKDSCQGQAASGRPDPNAPARTYVQGDFVMFDGDLYELTAASSAGERPDQTPAKWTKHAPLADDFRLVPGSPYKGMGLADTLE